MTEDEAKTKWCPQAGESRFNRQDELCLGSGCTVWRWEDVPASEYGLAGWRPGYCGLAPTPSKATHP